MANKAFDDLLSRIHNVLSGTKQDLQFVGDSALNAAKNSFEQWKQKPSNQIATKIANYTPNFVKPITTKTPGLYPQSQDQLKFNVPNIINATKVNLKAKAREFINETALNQTATKRALKTGQTNPVLAGNPFLPTEQRLGLEPVNYGDLAVNLGGISSPLELAGKSGLSTIMSAEKMVNGIKIEISGKKILRVPVGMNRKNMVKALKMAQKEGRTIELVPNKIAGGELPKGQGLLPSPKQMLQLPSGLEGKTDVVKSADDVIKHYVYDKSATKTISNAAAAPFADIPVNQGMEFLNHVEGVADSKNPLIRERAAQWNNLTNEMYVEMQKIAQRTKQDLGYVDGYVTHIWEQSPTEVKHAVEQLRKKTGFAESRKFITYQEGIEAGLTPKTTNPAEIMQMYTNNIENLKVNLNLLDELKPLTSTKPQAGFKPVVVPGISSSNHIVYAPSDLADKLTNLFNHESPISGLANTSSKMQDIVLSGGAPATPVNAFTAGQIIKDFTTLSPFRTYRAAKNAVRSMFAGTSRNYFVDETSNILELQRHGVNVNPDMDVSRMIDNGWLKNNFGSSFSEAWQRLVNEPTFKRFMPMEVIEHYKDIKKLAIKQGLTQNEAMDVAAQSTKNFFGMTDSAAEAVRSQFGKDVASTVFFAPKFREAMVNFWANNVKAVSPIAVKNGKVTFNNPLSLANKANTQFVFGAILTYLGFNSVNKQLNGRNLNENPPGDEFNLLIPLGNGDVMRLPMLPSIATLPRTMARAGLRIKEGDVGEVMKELKNLTSVSLRPALDVITNSDFFGNQIYNPDQPGQVGSISKYLFSQYTAHPYIRELTDPRYMKDPLYQRVIRALEAPISFTTEKSLDAKWYYSAKAAAMKEYSAGTLRGYNLLHPSKSANASDALNSTPNDTVSVKDKMQKAMIRANNPEVYFLERDIARATAEKTGAPVDPIYAVDAEDAIKYFRYQSLPPGSPDAKSMYKAYPQIGAIAAMRSEYFQKYPIESQAKSAYDEKPQPSEYVQAQMNAGVFDDPAVKAYLDANNQWIQTQRLLLGLTPSDSGYGYSSGKKKISIPSKISFKSRGLGKTLKSSSSNAAIKYVKPKAIKPPKVNLRVKV